MLLKTKNFRLTCHKKGFLIIALFLILGMNAQEMGVIDTTGTVKLKETQEAISRIENNKIQATSRYKVEGISAVVGSYVVLNRDIEQAYKEMESMGVSIEGVTRCELLSKLMEDKLYAHHAQIDSISVDEERIKAYTEQQMEYLIEQLGTEEAIAKFYRRDNIDAVRNELLEHHRTNELSRLMQGSIVDKLEVTPEEVRQFFYGIPEEERPYISTEVELAHILIEPKISDKNKQDVIDRLNEMREEVLQGNSSFSTLAVLYSKDGSRSQGGLIPAIRKDSPYVKEFKENAFSLRKEGDISEPFETEFGFHIIQLEKIRGQEIDVRHILLHPNISQSAIDEAKHLADSVRLEIKNDNISFADAARKYSDEKETRTNGGQLYNPQTLDVRFDLTKLDSDINSQIYNLEEGEVSPVIADRDHFGKSYFKIMKVLKRFEEHPADYQQDYAKIKDLALQQKQIKALNKWRKEKAQETYIHINEDYKDCRLTNEWLNSLN